MRDYRIGYKLDDILIGRKIKKKDFEKQIGVAKNYVSKIIWHEVNVSLELYLKIIEALDLEMDDLLINESDNNNIYSDVLPVPILESDTNN